MTAPKIPTPLEDAHTMIMALGPDDPPYTEEWAAYDRLHAFLSSDLIQKLQDPGMRAALEVITGAWPEVLALEGKATGGHWHTAFGMDQSVSDDTTVGYFGHVEPPFDFIFTTGERHGERGADSKLCAFLRNLIHRALKAKEEV